MSQSRRFPVVLVACATLLSGLAACGTGDDAAVSARPTTDATRPDGTPADALAWPLTGLPVRNGRSSALRHPVVVTKIDNTEGSAPQAGLRAADLVVEELVEGGVTRLAVFYYSQIPDEVGPVRSMRASDIGIVAPAAADVVTSGAAAITKTRITDAGIDFLTEGSTGFFRDPARRAPYNLMARLDEVVAERLAKRERPDDYLPWGPRKAKLPAGKPASSIAVTFSGARTSRWSYADGGYVNTNSFAAEGDAFRADSVLVLRVEVGDAGYLDPAGNKVPETRFVGRGEATLFHDGKAVEATWRKDGLDSTIWLGTDAADLAIPAGRVWIELIPQELGSVTYE
ncbi:DUF3048 domain-containing protein [Nocardioides salsibiostraticola]